MKIPWMVMAMTLCSIPALAGLALDHERAAFDLGGEWNLLAEHGGEPLWQAETAATLGPWTTVTVPANNLLTRAEDETEPAFRERRQKLQHVWLRRAFTLSGTEATRDAVLRWGGIRFGATAWINGTQVTEHEPMGPHTVLLPKGLLKAGENTITLRLRGWGGVPMSASGFPLIPAGGNTQSWGGKNPSVSGDIWLEFYDGVYLRRVLAVPDRVKGTVTFRCTLDGVGPAAEQVRVEARVTAPDGAETSAAADWDAAPNAPRELVCPLKSVLPWTPETPRLYTARLRATAGGRTLDEVSFTFGVRDITIENGRFRLNGQPLWLRGSNLLHEWLWGDKFNDNVKAYLVDEARAMSLNCFRTHTEPPHTRWADTADRHGMMLLAEMPLLYNHGEFGYTPEEYEVLHRNTLIDAENWITKLWNHPSIILWVISNESRDDNRWEAGPLFERAKTLDPTRPCMRTGEELVGTPDMVDVHTCFNVVRGAEGQLHVDMADLAARRDPARPLCNTEYMNWMWDASLRWLGRESHPGMRYEHAVCGLEHTEAMRRLEFDCLLPYMYSGWTRLGGRSIWREDYPSPMAAALHSAMAPVLASLDLFDRNHAAGTTLTVPLVLINERHEDVPATLDLYVTPEDPLLVPDANALTRSVWHESRALTFAADSKRTLSISVPVPKAEGTYYLAAVVRREGAAPVSSQRTLRSVDPDKYAAALKGRRVLLLGGDDALRSFLRRKGCAVSEWVRGTRIDADVVVLADPDRVGFAAEPGAMQLLRAFAEGGGRVVVPNLEKWPEEWKRLADVTIGYPEFKVHNPVICSRAHRYDGADHPALRDIPADTLWRWNGLPGEIVHEALLESPAVKSGKPLLWASNPKHAALLSVPMGRGEIVLCQLRVRDRLAPGTPRYDPAAERLMINLLRE